jgi:hypothetical protein
MASRTPTAQQFLGIKAWLDTGQLALVVFIPRSRGSGWRGFRAAGAKGRAIMALTFSKRADGISQSEIRVMTLECNRVSGINLAQGVCNTGVPHVVVEGVRKAMDDGFNT